MANTTTTATPKVTKAQRFDDIKAMLKNEPVPNGSTMEEIMAFIDKEKALLARKNAKKKEEGGETKTRQANRKLGEKVLDYMLTVDKEVNGMEIFKNVPALADYNTSKVAAVMSVLVEDGSVERIKNSKGVFYKVAC